MKGCSSNMLEYREINFLGVFRMRPGKDAEYPLNLFNLWLDYREAQGQSRAEIIREVNEKIKRRYDNNSFYRFKRQSVTVPEPLTTECMEPDLPEALKWYFTKNEWPVRGIDFDLLAEAVRPAVKIKS